MDNQDKLKRCESLPCISEAFNGDVIVNFRSKQFVAADLFQQDPVFALRMATNALEREIAVAIREKRAVLDEIENGTNRYRIDGGRFVDVGKK